MKTLTKEKARLGSEHEAGDPGHYYWPSEFPIAFCGHVNLKHATLGAATKAMLGPICEHCALKAADQPRERPIPHRQQGG